MLKKAASAVRSIPPWRSLIISILALTLLAGSDLIEVTIIVESPSLGDVSEEASTLVQYLLGAIGTLAGLITIYNFLTEDESHGPTDRVMFGGRNNEFHIHFDSQRDRRERRGQQHSDRPDEEREVAEGESNSGSDSDDDSQSSSS